MIILYFFGLISLIFIIFLWRLDRMASRSLEESIRMVQEYLDEETEERPLTLAWRAWGKALGKGTSIITGALPEWLRCRLHEVEEMNLAYWA